MIFTVHQYLAKYGMDPVNDHIVTHVMKRAAVTNSTLLTPKLEILCDCLQYAALKLPEIKQVMMESSIGKKLTTGKQHDIYDTVMSAAVETVFDDIREVWRLNGRDVTNLRMFTGFNRPVPKPYNSNNEPNNSMVLRIKHTMDWKYPGINSNDPNGLSIIAADLGMDKLTLSMLLHNPDNDTDTVTAFCNAAGISDKWVISGQIPDEYKPVLTMKELIQSYIEDFAYPSNEPWVLAAYYDMNHGLMTAMDNAIDSRSNSEDIRWRYYENAKSHLDNIIGHNAKEPSLRSNEAYDRYYDAMLRALDLVDY